MTHYRPAIALMLALCCTYLAEEGKGTTCQSEDSTVMMQTAMRVQIRTADKLQAKKDSINFADNARKEDKVRHLQKSTEDHNKAVHNVSRHSQLPTLKFKAKDVNQYDFALLKEKLQGLQTTCQQVETIATGFGTNVSSCIAAMHASLAVHTKDFSGINGVISEGFDCFYGVLLPLTGDAKNCALKAYYALDFLVADDILIHVLAAEDFVVQAANALEATRFKDTLAIMSSPKAATMCALVPHVLRGLENAVASFLLSMTSFDVVAVLNKLKGGPGLQALKDGGYVGSFSIVHKAADAITANVSVPVKWFQDAINAILSHGFCNEEVFSYPGASNLPISLPRSLM